MRNFGSAATYPMMPHRRAVMICQSNRVVLKRLGDLRPSTDRIDPTFFPAVIQQFLTDAPGHLAGIGEALQSGNADALMKSAHAFKGGCKNMGAGPLGNICFEFEEKGRAGEAQGLNECFERLQTEFVQKIQASR